eukprot:CAMPEP_0118913518 /NCGR_PEP_ID=MMETSP1166-20130328/14299_1 /TAXON_ID=1104430 /ORGANISM="Chrysoreinhardia sp, Strain CCMP3193" /LENGTH=319 /DNA_ID=CAMNT_0006853081 /DNA_START=460 /DNA_END=1415 /DNA_ORIENTATION=+
MTWLDFFLLHFSARRRRRRAAPGRGVFEEVGETSLGFEGDAAVEAVVEFVPFLAVGFDPLRRREGAPEVGGAVCDLVLSEGADGGVARDEGSSGGDVVGPLALVDGGLGDLGAPEGILEARGAAVARGEAEDFRVELGVLEDGAAEEVVEGAVVDFGVGEVHRLRGEVVRMLDGVGAGEVGAEGRVALEADAGDDDVAGEETAAAGLFDDDAAGREGVDLADLGRELAHVVGDEPDVRDGDRMAPVLDLRRPALRRRRPGGRVELLPLAHLLDVRRGVVVRKIVVQGLDEVQVVDYFRAHGPGAPREADDRRGPVLEGR